MAVLKITGDEYGFTWSVSGLSSPFDTSTYVRIGLTPYSFENGTYDEPTIVKDMDGYEVYVECENSPGSTTATSVNFGWVDFNPDTYTLYGFSETQNGQYWIINGSNGGGVTFTVRDAEPEPPLVEPWDWNPSDNSELSKQIKSFYNTLMGNVDVSTGFSHTVWNALVDKVAEMRVAKGKTEWETKSGNKTFLSKSNCKVSKGSTLSAEKYNALRWQIGSISSTNVAPYYVLDVEQGDPILQKHFFGLTTVLNNIINNL